MILKIEGYTVDSIKVKGVAIAGEDIKKELKLDWYNFRHF